MVLAAARADSASRSCDHASLTFSFAALARAFASRSALFTSAFFARSSLFSSFTCGTEGVGGCEYDAIGWGVDGVEWDPRLDSPLVHHLGEVLVLRRDVLADREQCTLAELLERQRAQLHRLLVVVAVLQQPRELEELVMELGREVRGEW